MNITVNGVMLYKKHELIELVELADDGDEHLRH